MALIDEQIARIIAFTTVVESYDSTSSDDMSALKRRVEQARRDIADTEQRRYGGGDKAISIVILDSALKTRYAETVSALKRQRSGVKDEITALNFSTKVSLSDRAVSVLRAEKLID